MGKGNFPLYAFNRGEVSRLALGRVDLDRMRLSAEEQVNFQPMVLGPMMLRPGLEHLGSTRSDLKPLFVPFVFGADDTAALELTSAPVTITVASPAVVTETAHGLSRGQPVAFATTDFLPSGITPGITYFVAGTVAANSYNLSTAPNGTPIDTTGKQKGTHTRSVMRVWVDDEPVKRAVVSGSVPNGDFSSASGWLLKATDGCAATINADGKLVLTAPARGGKASCYRKIVLKDQLKIEHAFRIVVERGPILFRVGSKLDADDYIETTQLMEGTHSLAFTPDAGNGEVHIYFESNAPAQRIVDSITIEKAGFLELPTPWGATDLDYVRHAQSGDVVFVACQGIHPYRIERRGTRSWSVVKYLTSNGPMKAIAGADIKLWPTDMFGTSFLNAKEAYFTKEHEGCLFRLFTNGQTNRAVLGDDDTYTDPIRITGVTGSDRKFTFKVTGLTGTGTKLALERSLEEGDLGIGFQKVFGGIAVDKTYEYLDLERDGARADNAPGSGNFANVIAFYRVGIDNYGKGAPTIEFREGSGVAGLKSGGRAGFCRVTRFVHAKQVEIEVLTPFSSVAKTKDWQEGEWSAASGYPSAVAFHDGRLWWAGGDRSGLRCRTITAISTSKRRATPRRSRAPSATARSTPSTGCCRSRG